MTVGCNCLLGVISVGLYDKQRLVLWPALFERVALECRNPAAVKPEHGSGPTSEVRMNQVRLRRLLDVAIAGFQANGSWRHLEIYEKTDATLFSRCNRGIRYLIAKHTFLRVTAHKHI